MFLSCLCAFFSLMSVTLIICPFGFTTLCVCCFFPDVIDAPTVFAHCSQSNILMWEGTFCFQVATAILEELQGWALREGELGPRRRTPNYSNKSIKFPGIGWHEQRSPLPKLYRYSTQQKYMLRVCSKPWMSPITLIIYDTCT